ncbi:MAG TPA: polysaccharide deacetylase family protein [Pirellulales bacterium]|nr:polysaccharide deacetylase family protein [Pirellulales bacterium]
MLNVFITVDTEAWPRHPEWRRSRLREDIERDVYGATPAGRFGVAYQMDVLDAHGLKAVFFVEALFACATGLASLRQLVSQIESRGHEVQLHIHPEWLAWIEPSPLPRRTAQNLKELSQEEQKVLISLGLQNLREAGAGNVCAFRAGNYGANFDTLRALAHHGVRYDTSYNVCYLDSDCGLHTPRALLQPEEIHGVREFPITFFQDWPGHFRHAQLCACSSQELEHALDEAWRRGWRSFVLVSHSFELLKRRKQPPLPPLPDGTVIRRFERLCRFLSTNRDRFGTCGFRDLDNTPLGPCLADEPLRSTVRRTAWRFGEQAVRRLWVGR